MFCALLCHTTTNPDLTAIAVRIIAVTTSQIGIGLETAAATGEWVNGEKGKGEL